MADDESKASALIEEMLSHMKTDVIGYDPASEVASFYANRCVFITGATGFIGKALIEKLVRSCRDIKRIYLLIRSKRGKEAKDRLAAILDSQIFDRVKSLPGGAELLQEKLYAVRGDITLPKFGISPEDMELLSRDVSIVFNSAASVRFVEPIDIAVRNNIYSVGQLVEVCDQLANLEAIVHLSTAYSNCHKSDTIYEIFYDPPMTGDQISATVSSILKVQDELDNVSLSNRAKRPSSSSDTCKSDDDAQQDRGVPCRLQDFYPPRAAPGSPGAPPSLMDKFAEEALIRGNRPNIYCLTKAIAESYLLELTQRRPDRYLNDKIPVAVVRPSIVIGAWREPAAGFVDSYAGPIKSNLDMTLGLVHVNPGKRHVRTDLVPVDIVTNMILCAGWFITNDDDSGRHQRPAATEDGQRQGQADDAMTSDPELRSRTNKSKSLQKLASGRSQCSLPAVNRDQGAYVFNIVTGAKNPTCWGQLLDAIYECAYKYPSKYLFRLPTCGFVSERNYKIFDYFLHQIPAQIVDSIQVYLGGKELTKNTSLVVGCYRNNLMVETLIPFLTRQWSMNDANTRALYERLSPLDKELFQFDVTRIEWPRYLRNYIMGAHMYLLRDEILDKRALVTGLKKLRTRQTVYHVSLALLFLAFYYFCLHRSQLESALLSLLGL